MSVSITSYSSNPLRNSVTAKLLTTVVTELLAHQITIKPRFYTVAYNLNINNNLSDWGASFNSTNRFLDFMFSLAASFLMLFKRIDNIAPIPCQGFSPPLFRMDDFSAKSA